VNPHDFTAPPDPIGPEGGDPLSADVFAAFQQATHLHRQLFMRLLADKGGHPGRTMVLGVLATHEGIAQRDLAEQMHLARPTITIMLQKMEHEGLIERWDDPDDQRLTRIRLTDAGRAQSRLMADTLSRYVGASIGTLSETDRTELARLLGLMNDNTAAALKELDA
jgi:DNA-binding MarR family transcriptional regulator